MKRNNAEMRPWVTLLSILLLIRRRLYRTWTRSACRVYSSFWVYPPDGEDPPSGDPPGWSDSSDADEALPPRRRRGQGRQATAPALPPHLYPTVGAITDDLALETNDRGNFSACIPEGFALSAEALVRFQSPTLAIIRQTDRGARRMFLSDLRDLERYAFPKINRN